MHHDQIKSQGVHGLSLKGDLLAEKRMKKQSKRVCFSEDHQVVGTVPNRRESSEEEIHTRWFRKPEYAMLIWESSVTLTMHKCEKKRHLVDDVLLCCRGLLDKETVQTRQEERYFINTLVLFQLRLNQGKGKEETIAQLYHKCSNPTNRRARDEALCDEKDVKHYASEAAESPPEDNKGFQHTQEKNRATIEELIVTELEKSDCHDLTEQALKKSLHRLNKRKRLEKEEMILLHQLQQLADIYMDPSLSPDAKAAVELAATALLQDSPISNFEEANQMRHNEGVGPSAVNHTLVLQDHADLNASEVKPTALELWSCQTGLQKESKRQKLL
jgi:hypothetical protein